MIRATSAPTRRRPKKASYQWSHRPIQPEASATQRRTKASVWRRISQTPPSREDCHSHSTPSTIHNHGAPNRPPKKQDTEGTISQWAQTYYCTYAPDIDSESPIGKSLPPPKGGAGLRPFATHY
ncbi:hypothetical protein L484_000304 [Morus notabilis]|uniref:Uncharacterized protein n=1 Tax=Morus notabilis TaxID=981085 RepID=W9SEA6_9ROSA|nr:hypothetical protein L484_000304 [Morus notabilis]